MIATFLILKFTEFFFEVFLDVFITKMRSMRGACGV